LLAGDQFEMAATSKEVAVLLGVLGVAFCLNWGLARLNCIQL
jgi:hypothetical protein